MSAHCLPARPIPNYYVVMIDYGRDGREAVVDPEMTYNAVTERVRTGEYKRILWIHHIDENGVDDVTDAILHDAGADIDTVLA
jgi:hypothetical protein